MIGKRSLMIKIRITVIFVSPWQEMIEMIFMKSDKCQLWMMMQCMKENGIDNEM